jgi:hypothetical protein
VNGAGIKIGVMSNGVDSLAARQAAGELPAGLTVLAGQGGTGDEGTAMLELVYDLAPGAQLFYATALPSNAQFATNIKALRTAGCDIIIDDVSYFNESPFQNGQAASVVSPGNAGAIAQAVNDVTIGPQAGALYFSSAANSGNKNDGTAGAWEGDFVSGGATSPPMPAGSVHDFGGGVTLDPLLTAGRVTLKWSDPIGGSGNDYDLFVLNAANTAVAASSTNIQSGTQDPYEDVGNRTAGTTGRYRQEDRCGKSISSSEREWRRLDDLDRRSYLRSQRRCKYDQRRRYAGRPCSAKFGGRSVSERS